jgi:hypothetical protein
VGGVGLERQVAEFVDDQEPRLGEVGEAFFQPALGAGLGERGHERHGGDKLYGVAGEDRLAAEGDGDHPERQAVRGPRGEMRLADARRAEQEQVLAVGDPPTGGEIADLLRIDRGLGVVVEAGEILDRREVGELEGHVDAPMVLAGDLALQEQGQGLAGREVGAGRLVQEVVELIADAGQLQPGQHRIERVEHWGRSLGAGHQKAPPTSAS